MERSVKGVSLTKLTRGHYFPSAISISLLPCELEFRCLYMEVIKPTSESFNKD